MMPWYIHTINRIYAKDCAAKKDGRWVAAVAVPYPTTLTERLRAAWWIVTGRAHAFRWPEAGDLERALGR